MLFVTTTDSLLNGLKIVSNAINQNNTANPILSHVLIQAQDGKVIFTGSNGEMRITTEITAMVMKAGAVTLMAKKIKDIADKLPAGDVKVEALGDESNTVHISCNKAKYRLYSLDPADYPGNTEFEKVWEFTISARTLMNALNKVCYARSVDESRKPLNSILVSINSGMFNTVATDGRRLALVEQPYEANGENGESLNGEFILPYSTSTLAELRALNGDEDVLVQINNSAALFKCGSTVMISNLMNMRYPNYRAVIAGNFQNKLTFSRQRFKEVVTRMKIMVDSSNGNNTSVKLSLNPGVMTITADSTYGGSSEEMEINYDGSPVELDFNPQYLVEPLDRLECEDVTMCFNNSSTPVHMMGDPGFIYVLMPMRM